MVVCFEMIIKVSKKLVYKERGGEKILFIKEEVGRGRRTIIRFFYSQNATIFIKLLCTTGQRKL